MSKNGLVLAWDASHCLWFFQLFINPCNTCFLSFFVPFPFFSAIAVVPVFFLFFSHQLRDNSEHADDQMDIVAEDTLEEVALKFMDSVHTLALKVDAVEDGELVSGLLSDLLARIVQEVAKTDQKTRIAEGIASSSAFFRLLLTSSTLIRITFVFPA